MKKILCLIGLCLVLSIGSAFARDLQEAWMARDGGGGIIGFTLDRNTQAQTAVLNGTNTVNFTTPTNTMLIKCTPENSTAAYWVRLDGTNATVPSATHNSTTFTSSIPNLNTTLVSAGQVISITAEVANKITVEYFK